MTTLERAITISPEYSDLVSKLSDIEFNALKQSIQNNGQQIPIIVNQNGVILDGHHRYRACAELGIPPKIAVMTFNTQDEERLFVIDANLVRRQLNAYQRGVLALKKKPILANIALENMKQGRVSQNKETLHVDEQLAKEAGMSKGQLYKVEKIEKEGSKRLKELVLNDELTINKAFRLIGKNIEAYLMYDSWFESLKENMAEIKPGTAEAEEARKYMEKMDSDVKSITTEEWGSSEGLRKYFIALCGGIDKYNLVHFANLMGMLPTETCKMVLGNVITSEEKWDKFESLRDKVKNMRWFTTIELTPEERAVMYEIPQSMIDSMKDYVCFINPQQSNNATTL